MESAWYRGWVYFIVATSVFLLVGIILGLLMSGNNELRFFDFIKIIVTVLLTNVFVYAVLGMILAHYDDERE